MVNEIKCVQIRGASGQRKGNEPLRECDFGVSAEKLGLHIGGESKGERGIFMEFDLHGQDLFKVMFDFSLISPEMAEELADMMKARVVLNRALLKNNLSGSSDSKE